MPKKLRIILDLANIPLERPPGLQTSLVIGDFNKIHKKIGIASEGLSTGAQPQDLDNCLRPPLESMFWRKRCWIYWPTMIDLI